MSEARKISYWVFASLAVATVYWGLSSELLAGLFSFLVLDLTHKRLVTAMPRAARWLSLAIFFVFSVFFIWMLGQFLRLSIERVPEMATVILPRLNSTATAYGLSIPGSLEDLRGMIIPALVEHAQSLTKTSGLLTKEIFEILVSILVAIFFHLRISKNGAIQAKTAQTGALLDSFVREFSKRVGFFVGGFETIFRIQIILAIFRAAVIAIFLLWTRTPWGSFLLVTTLLLSVIPIVGSLTSSVLIAAAAFTVSFHMAIGTIVFLLLLHQAEYLLYSRLAGTGYALPTWLILLGLLVGERCLGLAGLILAPVVIHYFEEELRQAGMQ